MKCPKCNFASFEYLNTCKKCGNDLTLHKTELGIDYPQYSSLGLMATLRHEASPQTAMAETATMVDDHLGAEQLAETSASDKLSGTSGFEAAIGSDTDFTNIGGGVDLGEHDELDLSGLGESADETASITLPPVEEEEIDLGVDIAVEPAAEPAKKETAEVSTKAAAPGELDGIDFDLGELEETPAPPEKTAALDLGEVEEAVAPAAKDEEFQIDLGDLDLASPAEEASAPPAAKEAVADIELGDIDLSPAEEKPAAPKQAAPAAPASDFDMDGFDLDLNLDDVDLADPGKDAGKKEEPKKDEKKKDDLDIDIDLSDLKLD